MTTSIILSLQKSGNISISFTSSDELKHTICVYEIRFASMSEYINRFFSELRATDYLSVVL